MDVLTRVERFPSLEVAQLRCQIPGIGGVSLVLWVVLNSLRSIQTETDRVDSLVDVCRESAQCGVLEDGSHWHINVLPFLTNFEQKLLRNDTVSTKVEEGVCAVDAVGCHTTVGEKFGPDLGHLLLSGCQSCTQLRWSPSTCGSDLLGLREGQSRTIDFAVGVERESQHGNDDRGNCVGRKLLLEVLAHIITQVLEALEHGDHVGLFCRCLISATLLEPVLPSLHLRDDVADECLVFIRVALEQGDVLAN